MINLTPDDIKLNNRYALKNTRLIHYTFVALGTALAIMAITAISILSMLQTQNNLKKELDDQSAKLVSLKGIETQGQKLYDQITTINELLNRQVKFSSLLPDFAKILPPGAILKQLDFKTTDITGETTSPTTIPSNTSGATAPVAKTPDKPFVIYAAVTDRTIAATLLENIKARTDLFTSADLIDVSYTPPPINAQIGASTLTTKYPYQVTINAYFKKKVSTKTSANDEVQIIQPPADKKTEKAI